MDKDKTGKNEKLFSDKIEKNIDKLVKALHLSEIEKVYREKEIVKDLFTIDKRIPPKFKKGSLTPRIDFLLKHKNSDKITIIEVKVFKNINDLTHGLAQLLIYKEYLRTVCDATKIRGVLVADKIPTNDILAQVAKKNNLLIDFVEWNNDEIKILEAVNLGGRPNIWNDEIKLQKSIDNYFESTAEPTLSGLANWLGMSRETLNQYKDKTKFSDIIKRSRSMIEGIYEKELIYGKKQPTGVIFALKNMGWKDRTDVTSDDKPLPTPILGNELPKNNSNNETSPTR